MKKLVVHSIFICCAWLAVAGVQAQTIEFTARSSREQAATDEPFNLIYTLNVDGKFTAPNLSALKLLSGPNKGSQSYITGVNGKFSQRVSITYTFVVRGKKEGSVTIPPASLTLDGKTYKSNSVTVNITKGNTDLPGDDGTTQARSKYAFLQILPAKTKLVEGEPVLVVYRLFTVFGHNSQEDLEFDAQPGCWIQDLKPGKQGWPAATQKIGATKYNVFTLKKEILIPQKSGNLQLQAFDMTILSMVSQFESQRFAMVSNAPVLEVQPVPSPRPEGYLGAVGNYQLNTKISTQELKVNDPIDLIISLEGSGNIKLSDLPKPVFPADFEIYDPEISEKISVTEAGMSGSKEFKYLLIPRHPGNFKIEKTAFAYYDLDKKKYVTLYMPEFSIKVKKEDGTEVSGNENITRKNDVKILEQDIRYIKPVETGDLTSSGFTGTTWYYVTAGVIPLLCFLLLLVPRKSEEEANRTKNLNRISREIEALLQQASGHLNAGNKTSFYDSIAQALQIQLLKKTGVEAIQLSHQQLGDELKKRGVNDETASETVQLFQTFEMARYASMTAADEDALLKRTEAIIWQLNKLNA